MPAWHEKLLVVASKLTVLTADEANIFREARRNVTARPIWPISTRCWILLELYLVFVYHNTQSFLMMTSLDVDSYSSQISGPLQLTIMEFGWTFRYSILRRLHLTNWLARSIQSAPKYDCSGWSSQFGVILIMAWGVFTQITTRPIIWQALAGLYDEAE